MCTEHSRVILDPRAEIFQLTVGFKVQSSIFRSNVVPGLRIPRFGFRVSDFIRTHEPDQFSTTLIGPSTSTFPEA